MMKTLQRGIPTSIRLKSRGLSRAHLVGEVGCRGDNNQPKTSHRKRRAITESRLAFNPVGRRNAMTDAMGKWDLVA